MMAALCSSACALRPSKAQHLVTRRSAALLPAGRRGPLRVAAEARDEDKPDVPTSREGEPVFTTSFLTPAFTRRREHLVGRVAALGFGFSIIGEILTGVGPISQLHYETGLSFNFLYTLIVGVAAINLIGGLRPGSPTFERANLVDASKRGPSPNLFKEPRKFFMQYDAYIGRVAMAGFAGACILEYMWGGQAPLAHLGLITPGTPVSNAPWLVTIPAFLFLLTGFGMLASAGDPGKNTENY